MMLKNHAVENYSTYTQRIINELNLNENNGWHERVNDVRVVLTAPRSGSSLTFHAVSSSPHILSPAGEHEPWLLLSGNAYPFTGSSAIEGGQIRNIDLLRKFIRNDIIVSDPTASVHEQEIIFRNRECIRQTEGLAGRMACRASEIGVAGFWMPIEVKPLISIPEGRRATDEELAAKPLIFKAPGDAYRLGMYEQLFPNATVTYTHLTRGYAQTVNGLLDSWGNNPEDFAAKPIGLFGEALEIGDYSACPVTRAYWCHDLPPDWQDYTKEHLVTVGALQWLRAHQSILKNFALADTIQFEDIYADRQRLETQLHTIAGEFDSHSLNDQIMPTKRPTPFRWHERRTKVFDQLREIIGQKMYDELCDTQLALGYSLDERTWY